MRSESSILFSAFCSVVLISACNPCDIEVVSDTAFIAPNCPVVTTADDATGDSESTGDATTLASDSSTGEPTCETDDDCGPTETCDKTTHLCEPVVCTWTHVPALGEAWGPCDGGSECGGDGVFCRVNDAATVCLPACANDACPASGCGGSCLNNDECAPACNSSADCPFPGMACVFTDDAFPFCGWSL